METEFKNLYFRMLDRMSDFKKQLKEAVTKTEDEYELGLLNGQISAMDIFNKFLVEELQNVNYDA